MCVCVCVCVCGVRTGGLLGAVCFNHCVHTCTHLHRLHRLHWAAAHCRRPYASYAPYPYLCRTPLHTRPHTTHPSLSHVPHVPHAPQVALTSLGPGSIADVRAAVAAARSAAAAAAGSSSSTGATASAAPTAAATATACGGGAAGSGQAAGGGGGGGGGGGSLLPAEVEWLRDWRLRLALSAPRRHAADLALQLALAAAVRGAAARDGGKRGIVKEGPGGCRFVSQILDTPFPVSALLQLTLTYAHSALALHTDTATLTLPQRHSYADIPALTLARTLTRARTTDLLRARGAAALRRGAVLRRGGGAAGARAGGGGGGAGGARGGAGGGGGVVGWRACVCV